MLKELRKSKGITATFVANKLNISRDRLERIESGQVPLPTEFLPVLSELYNISCSELIERRVEECKLKTSN